ncbi:MAG TPA: aspartate aminotransferase family protein [Symbiobacteriaceae bacterium]|jgi:putrescine aminotransferase|nr:aspartate aminotransferase family protein [Symbiobacteriaceae bacterium]
MNRHELTAAAWKQLDKDHVLHANTLLGAHEQTGALIMVKGEGATVTDIDGKEYIDGLGALWLANCGYGRKEMGEVAKQQMEQLHFWSLFWSYGNLPAVELATRLAGLTPQGLNHFFFTSGGSEANESSIKTARLYHVRRGNPGKTAVIALQKAYHGVSYGAMTATGLESVRSNFAPYVENFHHIASPYCYRCPLAKEYPSCQLACAHELEKKILELGPENVAAFMAEPVGGVGGVIEPPAEYFQYVRQICDKYEILFIADEVITGFGRTGTWFGIEHYGVVPDIISCAKGLTSGYMPMGASIVHDRVYEVLKGDGTAYFNHGFTYSGHPVAAAVAMENLRILEAEGLLERAATLGASARRQLLERNNPYIGDVRGKGLMIGIELVQDRATKQPPLDPDVHKKVEMACRAEGLLVRALAGFVIAISPPLVITEEQLARVIAILDRAIRTSLQA